MAFIKLIKGPTNAGKTQRLIDEYHQLLQRGIRSDGILVLVRNRRQSIIWRKNLNINKFSSIRIQSYFGFIQSEIKKYWPLISSSIEGFKKSTIEPVFLTSEISQFVLNRFIDQLRKEGRFSELTSTSEKIAIETLSVLSRAGTSNIDIKKAGKRLFDANLQKNASIERLFQDLQILIDKYIDYCKEKGYIDYYMAVNIYNSNLFTSEAYIERLNNEIKYLFVDGIEEAVPCEADLICHIMDNTEQTTISYCTDGAVSRKQGASPEYIERTIISRCTEFVELNEKRGKVKTEADIQAELRSEMITNVCTRIDDCLSRGYKPNDIAVVCPIGDNVLAYYIENWFGKQGIKVVNLARTGSYMEDSFIRALISLACLSHPQWNINPPSHDISNFLSMVLGLDKVRGALLAREVMKQKPFTMPEIDSLEFRERVGFVNAEKYYFLKNWIEEYRKEEANSIEIFLQKALRAIMMRIPKIEEHINSCRILIESAETFSNTLASMLGDDTGKQFIEMVKKGIKPAETITEFEQKMFAEAIMISTPVAYISSSIRRKVEFLVDVSSQLWFKSDVEQISNPYIFSSDWKEGDVWTQELDEKFKILKNETLMRRLKNCCGEKLILAESQYNQDGYENTMYN